MDTRMKPGDIVRHFKGNEYEILCFALDSETREELVVYRARYGDGSTWVRKKEMFFSPVDAGKYPGVRQKYRFEKIEEACRG